MNRPLVLLLVGPWPKLSVPKLSSICGPKIAGPLALLNIYKSLLCG